MGTHIVTGILNDPNFTWQDPDTDLYNAELIEKNKNIPDAEILEQFESKRQALLRLVNEIPERAFADTNIEGWLAADVVGHYDEHNPAEFKRAEWIILFFSRLEAIWETALRIAQGGGFEFLAADIGEEKILCL